MSALITQPTSGDRKTGPIAATYRAGSGCMYGSCPSSCPSMPESGKGTDTVDREYLRALLAAVPRGGVAWTYSHFAPARWIQAMRARLRAGKPTTVINASADTEKQAADWARRLIPAVVAVPASVEPRKHWTAHGVRFVRCPAEYSKSIQCINCGGGRPLCARPDRDYVIAFHAHGAAKRQIGVEQRGGCYGSGGNVALHWRRLAARPTESCAAKLTAWVKTLRPGSMLRHHVVGDIGSDA